MNPIQLSKNITVGPQLTKSDEWEQLSHHGVKTVVNLSRKGELDQLKPDEEERLVVAHGMDYVHYPVSINTMNTKQVDDFLDLIKQHPVPVYMHCRLGQRSGPFGLILHAMRQRLPLFKVKDRAQELGLVWKAPFLNEFVPQYLELARARAAA